MEQVKLTGGAGYEWLRGKGYPYRDTMELTVSAERYPGGGQYGVEIPVINSMAELERTVKLISNNGVYVTRFNETHGSFLLSDAELEDMFALCRQNGYGILISMGPRPEYDPKAAFYRSSFGLEMGRRINNNDAIRACVEESVRLAELGCRGIIVYDVGVMQILAEMRAEGVLPADMVFKTSTHCMATNPFLARIFAQNGADSVTVAHDVSLPVLHEMRRLNPGLALDVPIDVYKAKGGFIRFYEIAEIVQVAAPVMLKMGASAQNHPYDATGESTSAARVARVARGLEMLDRHLPDRTRLSPQSRHCCIPAAPRSGPADPGPAASTITA